MKYIIHSLIRFCIRITSYFFFEKIVVSGTENLPLKGPVIFASNHPNAFLDSLVMTTCIKRDFYYTARGDFFKSRIAATLLDYLQILPLFRRKEGKELMYKNNETFSNCIKVFKRNGAVSIFSEGISENKWELRPLRKGTARLAFEAWNNPDVGDKLKVVPIAVHYSSWLKIHPVVYVEFLENIEKKSFNNISEPAIQLKKFNEKLTNILSEKCVIVDNSSATSIQNKVIGFVLKNVSNGASVAKFFQNKYFTAGNEKFKTNYFSLSEFLTKENITYYNESKAGIISFLFSCILYSFAFILNAIPYYLTKTIVRIGTKSNDFHDSMLYCLPLVIYPIYLVFSFLILKSNFNFWIALSFIILALMGASEYEWAKRTIFCFLKKEKLKIVREMFNRLSQTGNG